MKYIQINSILQLKYAYDIIQDLGEYYPNFYDWYWNKVIPNIYLGKNHVTLMLDNKDTPLGVSIIKKDINERKLCCLRVNKDNINKGYGLHLIDYSLKLLGEDKPLCSVSEEIINEYSRIFINRYNFNITHVYKGLYLKNKLEYEFNGNRKLKEISNY